MTGPGVRPGFTGWTRGGVGRLAGVSSRTIDTVLNQRQFASPAEPQIDPVIYRADVADATTTKRDDYGASLSQSDIKASASLPTQEY